MQKVLWKLVKSLSLWKTCQCHRFHPPPMETLLPLIRKSFLDEVIQIVGIYQNNKYKKMYHVLGKMASKSITAAFVAQKTFMSIARIHAYFWKRQDLLLSSNQSWLRGHAWLQGNGKESWEASQGLISKIYQNLVSQKEFADDDKSTKLLDWDPLVRDMVHKAVQGISWEDQQKRLNAQDTHWTLVHGDFWPGNVMWMVPDQSIRLVDWEMCGIGSGPQDLGQYIISHMDAETRRECERSLLETYHTELVQAGVQNVSFDYCWNEYRIGGVERWLWFLVWFLGQGESMKSWSQFFHNQIKDFVHDHDLKVQDVCQVRP